MKPFGYVYIITNVINGKVYIGKTESTLNERWYTHRWRANHLDKVENPLVIDLAIAKYGENSFEIDELDKAFNKEDLLRAEAYWIKFYYATNPDKGYNIDPIGEIIYSDDYESIWKIPNESESKIQKKAKWRESLIKKKIPLEKEDDFKQDLIKLSGVQLEEEYGFFNNRRALLREIRRILQDESIKTISQAKKAIGGQVYNPKKTILPDQEEEFITDFKLLSGVNLENKYHMSRRILVRNIKEIYKKYGSPILKSATSLEDIKRILEGRLYSDPKKKIHSKLEQEFINDVRKGLRRRELCNKYEIGTTVFYRELERICGSKYLTKVRDTKWDIPSREKTYVPIKKEEHFKEDLKILSGSQLEYKYKISDRRILLREIRRILKNEDLKSMDIVKKHVGGEIYDRTALKKRIPKEKEKEFKADVRGGLTIHKLCVKYRFGTKVLYRELERLFKTKLLKEARKI
ncbi:MAG: GIY-YIG nuclease family protein [Candidatus Odinarchaeota archaeon]